MSSILLLIVPAATGYAVPYRRDSTIEEINELANLPTKKLINTTTYQLINSQTYQHITLKIFYKTHPILHPLLERFKGKKLENSRKLSPWTFRFMSIFKNTTCI